MGMAILISVFFCTLIPNVLIYYLKVKCRFYVLQILPYKNYILQYLFLILKHFIYCHDIYVY